MKKIIYLLVSLIVVSIVGADVDMSLNVISDEDINANIGLQGNNVNVNIDGLNFNEEVDKINQDISDAGSISDVFYRIYNLFMNYKYTEKIFEIVDINDLNDPYEARARYVFDTYFVPRSELYNIINQQQNQIYNLQLEVASMQETMDTEKLCEARLKLAKQYNLTSVTCDGVTYYNHLPNDEFIVITPVESMPIQINNQVEEEPKTCEELAYMKLPQSYSLKLQLSQLISIYKRGDAKALNLTMEWVSQEAKDAYEFYINCS